MEIRGGQDGVPMKISLIGVGAILGSHLNFAFNFALNALFILCLCMVDVYVMSSHNKHT